MRQNYWGAIALHTPPCSAVPANRHFVKYVKMAYSFYRGDNNLQLEPFLNHVVKAIVLVINGGQKPRKVFAYSYGSRSTRSIVYLKCTFFFFTCSSNYFHARLASFSATSYGTNVHGPLHKVCCNLRDSFLAGSWPIWRVISIYWKKGIMSGISGWCSI